MAKLSDFQVQQPTRNFLAEELVARNAARIHPTVHWSDTRIEETQGSAESRPYLRDAAVKSVGRRKNLHAVLDRCLSDANIEEGAQTGRMHAVLDRLLDEEEEEEKEPDDDEEPKEESDAEEALDSLQTELRRVFRRPSQKKSAPRAKTVRRSSSYVCDADFIAKFINPDLTCIEVENWLYDKVYETQKSNPNRSFWVGLSDFLRSQPDGARIRDCRPQTLSMLISKTLAA